jgi:IS30 family transposase
MRQYQHFSFNEREELSRQLAKNISLRVIAGTLDRSPSTISREIKRCNNRLEYRAIKAQKKAVKLAQTQRRKPKLETNMLLRNRVMEQLKDRWSPEQIANRHKVVYPDDMPMQVSHETIYRYLYVYPKATLKKQLIASLRRAHKHRRNGYKDRRKFSPIQDYSGIAQRPSEADSRLIPGHWEGDLVMGKANRSALGTLVERTTRKVILVRLRHQDSATVRKAFANKLRHLPKSLKRSLTYDQGKEMAEHKLFTAQTKISVYFADPHSPWQRGSNENTNGLLRQYFPRGTDFSKVSSKRINKVQESLNNRPRQTLKWLTPNEVFAQSVALEV